MWKGRDVLPDDVAKLLAEHEQLVRAGGPLANARPLIKTLQRKLETHGQSLDVTYMVGMDVLPALFEVVAGATEEAPPPLAQVDPEDFELRQRIRQKWLRYVERRGGQQERFKKAVRESYGYRCVMCGAKFPPTALNRNPGVDAAHIVPWSQYDLDEVHNGIALCKLHHWAFDEGLLNITFENGVYEITLSAAASDSLPGDSFSIELLAQAVGPIPHDRLPSRPENRPLPFLLRKRLEDLG